MAVNDTETRYYRVGGSGRPIYLVAGTTLVLLVGVVLIVFATASRPMIVPLIVFGVAYLLAAMWGTWFSGYRVPYDVGIGRDELVWLALFRTRQVALGDVREFRRARWSHGFGVLVLAGGERLLVPKRKDFAQFAVTLGRAVPSLRISA
jgi:hypothetical protein